MLKIAAIFGGVALAASLLTGDEPRKENALEVALAAKCASYKDIVVPGYIHHTAEDQCEIDRIIVNDLLSNR